MKIGEDYKYLLKMIIGITGSIGSGKTAAAKLFFKYHYKRIDADEISHDLMKNNSEIRKKLIKIFGKEILGSNKNIDRKKLGNIVFNDGRKLRKLSSVMHPAIIKEIKNRIKKIKKECGDKTKIIIDAPLLLEAGAGRLVDKVIVVKAFHENVVERNKKFTMEQLKKISMAQMGLDKKLKKADFMIDNTGDLKNLENQVKRIANKLNQ